MSQFFFPEQRGHFVKGILGRKIGMTQIFDPETGGVTSVTVIEAGPCPVFDKGINAIPKCGLNYNSAARLLIKQNRTPEAKQKLDTLIKIAPNSDGAVIAKEILASVGAKH